MEFNKIQFPDTWNKYSLDDVCSKITSGGTPSRTKPEFYENGIINWVKTKELNNYYIYDTEEKITEEALKKSSAKLLPTNTILLAMYGATVGELGILSKEMACNQACCALITNPKICDYRYLFYLLGFHKEEIINLATGAAQQNISAKIIRGLTFRFPDIDQQKEIADILNTLDKKIELNTQINQTLEQIAQTIFKSWFIDFDPVHAKANALASGQTLEQATQAAMAVISGKNTQELHRLQTANPEQYQQLWEIAEAFPSGFDEEGVPWGWGQTTLSEVCSMKNGYAFKSSDWTEEGIPVIKIGSVKPMIVEVDGNGFVDEEHSVLHSEFLLTEGDIVVGLTGYVGEVGRIPQGRTAMLNQRVAKFIPNKLNEQQDYYSFVYCLVRDKSFKAFAETNAKGSAQANISTKELLNYSIILASSEIQMKFESLIKPLLDKILVNSGNNENLSKVRDLLLPKLLSGELNGLPEKTI